MSEAVETKPLTDEDLKTMEGNASDCYDCGSIVSDVERLVAEVRRLRSEEKALRLRLHDMYENWFPDNGKVDQALKDVERLRSDEWLEKAAREIAMPEVAVSLTLPKDFEGEIERTVREDYMPILRKHRDASS